MPAPARSFSTVMVCTVASTLAAATLAQPLTLTHRGGITLGASTTDQNGASFTVTGVSGIVHDPGSGPTHYWGIRDNSNKLVKYSIALGPDASITGASYIGGFSFAESRDFEDIVIASPPGLPGAPQAATSVAICEEGTPAVRVFSLANGALLRTLPTPSPFSSRRSNFGLESLASSPGALASMGDEPPEGEVWTMNEEALSVDGPVSTPTNGTVVRLLRYTVRAGVIAAAQQYAYFTEPMHGGNITGGRSGVSSLVRLPNGTLLLLERSLALALNPYQARIYELTLTGATDVSAIPSLVGATYTPVAKRLLYSGNLTKIEGLCLGPQLPNGNHAIIGIIDDDDPISDNRIESFELGGDITPCAADLDNGESLGLPDKAIDISDLLYFLKKFEMGGRRADLDDGSGAGQPDGGVDIADLLFFLGRFEAGC